MRGENTLGTRQNGAWARTFVVSPHLQLRRNKLPQQQKKVSSAKSQLCCVTHTSTSNSESVTLTAIQKGA